MAGANPSSVGDTCTYAGGTFPDDGQLVFAAQPVSVFRCLGPIAYTASVVAKKMRPREMAAPPKTCSAVPSDPPMLFLLIGSSTSLRISARSGCGRTMKNFPLSVPTKIFPSAITGGAFCDVPSGCVQSSFPVSMSYAFSRDPFSI